MKSAAKRIFAVPALLAVVTVFGLLSALFGDGAWDALSWAALGAPLAVALCFAMRRPISVN